MKEGERMKYLPPDYPDCGAMLDNCGNVVVWMRPAMLDDIIEELKAGGQAKELLDELRGQFAKDVFPISQGLNIDADLTET